MATATSTSETEQVQINSQFPEHRIGIQVYEEDGQFVATGDKEDCAQGIGSTVPRAVRAYAQAVERGEEVVDLG